MLKPKEGDKKSMLEWMKYKTSSFKPLTKEQNDLLMIFVFQKGRTIKQIREYLQITNDKARAAAFLLCVNGVFDFATTKHNPETFRKYKLKGDTAGWIFFKKEEKKQIRLIPSSQVSESEIRKIECRDLDAVILPESPQIPQLKPRDYDIPTHGWKSTNERIWDEFNKFMKTNNSSSVFMSEGELHLRYRGCKGDFLRIIKLINGALS